MTTRLTTVRIASQIRAELDRILEHESNLAEASGLLPRVDVAQSEEKLCLLFEVPGTESADLEVTIANRVATVSGNKKTAASPTVGARFLLVERQWGRFERSVELPSAVNPKEGRAVLQHGVLRIEFPLLLDQRNRTYRLEIETGERVE